MVMLSCTHSLQGFYSTQYVLYNYNYIYSMNYMTLYIYTFSTVFLCIYICAIFRQPLKRTTCVDRSGSSC